MTLEDKEIRYWLRQLRRDYLSRLDEVNAALDSMRSADIFEVGNNTTQSVECHQKNLLIELGYREANEQIMFPHTQKKGALRLVGTSPSG